MTTDGAAGGEPSWITVRIFTDAYEAVSAALFDAGVQGVQEVDAALVTHVPGAGAAAALVDAATAADPLARIDVHPLDVVDWSSAWKQGMTPQRAGTLTIVPPWLAAGRDAERTIVIDPAMAFGTGAHATTRGAVRLLHRVIRGGDRVADLGAGSAVLAIAAVRLGAVRVAAIEIDADAIANAEENIARNGVADRVTVIQGDAAVLLPLVAPVRVITANILSSVLIELLPAMSQAVSGDGQAILSGILDAERQDMLPAIERAGFVLAGEDSEDGWWSCVIGRR